jgi:hypothetical protein
MSGKATLKSFKAMLAEAKLPERTVEICLRGDLVADHEQAERDLEQAQKTATDSLAGSGVGEIVQRIEALEAEMRDSTVTFTLRALSKPRYRELVQAHPPRRGDDGEIVDDDKGMGLNVETFYEDLLRRSVADPELDDEDWTALLDTITDRQFELLGMAAFLLNRSDVDIPFSLAASRAKRTTSAE